MARIRTIKPSFFKNEDLSELPMSCRLLFIGLWTLSDVEGRLEDRPKRIKAELFPYDNIDVDDHLSRLQSAGFINRYEVGEMKVIEVVTFKKHQRITGSEASSKSELPEYQTKKEKVETSGNDLEATLESSGKHFGNTLETPRTTGKERKGKEEEGKGKEEDFFRDEVLENSILKFFGFNEIANFDKVKTVSEFCFCLKNSGRLDFFRTQFDSYCHLKNDYGGFKHSFKNFLGDQSKLFEDGAWNEENWTFRLNEEKEKSSAKKEKAPFSQQQPARGVEAALKFADVKMRE